jgi:predicted DNA-binding protein YlxM (UPF0122 family)
VRKPRRAPHLELFLYNGQMLNRTQISAASGLNFKSVCYRLRRGIPIDAPRMHQRTGKRRGTPIVSASLSYSDDPIAQAFLGYLLSRKPLSTEADVLRTFPDCSPEEARGLLRYLAHTMQLDRDVSVASLEEIAGVFGITRQAMEQLESRALAHYEKAMKRLRLSEKLRHGLDLLDELKGLRQARTNGRFRQRMAS